MIQSHAIPLPTLLTLVRLIGGPIVVPLLIVHSAPYDYLFVRIILALLFIAVSITDFFDGYFARKYKQTTQIGAALDHIADKLVTTATLLALLAIGKIYFFWAALLICRDIFIMGLRQVALEFGYHVPVGYLGKLKTASIMLLLIWLILTPLHGPSEDWQQHMQTALLVMSMVLSLLSAYHYCRTLAKKMPAYTKLIEPDNES